MHHLLDLFGNIGLREHRLRLGIVDKGDDVAQFLPRQLDLAAHFFLLQHDHRTRAAPHPRGKVEGVHDFVHEFCIQHRGVHTADAIDRMADDAALFGKEHSAAVCIHARQHEAGRHHLAHAVWGSGVGHGRCGGRDASEQCKPQCDLFYGLFSFWFRLIAVLASDTETSRRAGRRQVREARRRQ